MDAKLCAVFRPFTDTGVFSHGHLAALLGSALIVSAALHPPASAQSANDGSWVWTARGHASAPSPRSGVSAVWTGSKMLIWGGQLTGSSTYLNQGYRYEVQTDSWSPMSAKNAPVARYFHTAIWTGRELIIWGGGTDDTGGQGPACLNTGARYDPVTDTWHPMSTQGAPQGRLAHTAVWTGNEMIVWGGNNDAQDFGDGGRYNPATDTWKPVATYHAPTARSSLTAVWTGSEMIVWGGNYMTCSGYNCSFNYPAEMGRYDPSTDSWKTRVVAGAPALRADFSAVWNGQEMIIWGGYNGATYGDRTLLNSGARFNPLTWTWTALPTHSAPAARDQHVARWADEQMLIWGGSKSPNTGARYSPSANAWFPMATNGAPASAFSGEAVWTGEAMLVFDGKLFGYFQQGMYAWDGLPDAWQRQYFGANNPQAGPAADPDFDGLNNWQEYLAGTNPTNDASRLEVSLPGPPHNKRIEVRFEPVTAGRIYTLQASSNLNGGSFIPVASLYTNATASGGLFTLTNSVADPWFFRLKLRLP